MVITHDLIFQLNILGSSLFFFALITFVDLIILVWPKLVVLIQALLH